MDPLFFLLLGHIIGDYALQSDGMAAAKRNSVRLLILHAVIYSVTIASVSLIYDLFYKPHIFQAVLPWIIPLFAVHIVQDYIKSRFLSKSRQCYYIDQSMHLIALLALRIIVVG